MAVPPEDDGSVFAARGRLRGAIVVLVLLIAVAYSSSLSGELQFDDFTSVAENVAIRDLGALLRGGLLGIGRPITNLTFALNFAVAELDVRAYHATNVLLHIATVLLVFLLSRRILRRLQWRGSDGLALWLAGLFGLHPIQSQAVSYISQRAEVLSSLFYVAALLLLLDAEERGRTRRGFTTYVAALVAFVLALGSKAIAVTLPAVYLLCAVYFPPLESGTSQGWRRWRTQFALAMPFVLVSGVASYVQIRSLTPVTGSGFDLPSLDSGRYLLTELAVLVRYLAFLVWPSGQNVDHAFPLSNGILEPRTLMAGVLLVAFVAAAIGLLRWSNQGNPAGLILSRKGDADASQREFAIASALDPDLALQTRNAALSQERAGLVPQACATARTIAFLGPLHSIGRAPCV